MRDDLLNLLSARQGHFKLESGYHGDLWLDLDRLFIHSRAVQQFAVELAGRLAKYAPAAICGPLVGGALLAQMIAAELDVEFFYSERFVRASPDKLYPVGYRIPDGVRSLLDGKTIVMVDDVINAGSAVRGTFAALQESGAKLVAVGALLVLGDWAPGYFAARGIPSESLMQLPSGLWEPAQCPLCAAHVPLETPG
jgi:orotate phosphoribosyltransferase